LAQRDHIQFSKLGQRYCVTFALCHWPSVCLWRWCTLLRAYFSKKYFLK